MYEFVRGPLMWAAVIIFVGGMAYRIVSIVRLSQEKDKVVYDHFNFKWAAASILHWLLPLNRSTLNYPVYTILSFIFHIILLAAPIFLLAHNVLLFESWNFSLWTLPEEVTDYMTLILLGIIIFMIIRRATLPYVKIVTTPVDYLLLLMVAIPFLTGYLAYHQYFDYQTMLIVHILSGELMLVLIPFTKLSHAVLFFFTRAHIGSEFGQRRGTVTW